MLHALATGIWHTRQPFKALGADIGVRMTMLRLSGGLLVYSPVRATPALLAAAQGLGDVRWIVAPSRYHHLWAGDWAAAFPDAQFLAAPGLAAKRKDLSFTATLDDGYDPGWGDEVSHLHIQGMPSVNEVVLFHHEMRTLVCADLLNHQHNATGWDRVINRAIGATTAPSQTLLWRMAVRDKAAYRRSVGRILRWAPDRIGLSHGSPVFARGTELLEQALARSGALPHAPDTLAR